MNYQTIQKAAQDIGIDVSHIRTMIKNKDLTAHKIEGYIRIYIDIDELNASIKPINNVDEEIDLDKFMI